jgi:hypothetical protein
MHYEQHQGYTLAYSLSTTSDHRVGRCWIHVYSSAEDADHDRDRRFALHVDVGRLARNAMSPHANLEEVARVEALNRAKEMIDLRLFDQGRVYAERIGLDPDGQIRHRESIDE